MIDNKTIEEAAIKACPLTVHELTSGNITHSNRTRNSFKKGANWAIEQMSSELLRAKEENEKLKETIRLQERAGAELLIELRNLKSTSS